MNSFLSVKGLPNFQPGTSLANAIGDRLSIDDSNETFQAMSSIVSRTESNHDSEGRSITELENLKYKTELCRNFSIYGLCSYLSRCQFAHGYEELRSRTRHPKYKTELCRNFLLGHCKYGTRCQFLHKTEDIKGNSHTNESIAAIGTYLLTNLLAQSAVLTNLNSTLITPPFQPPDRMSLPYHCGIGMQQLHLSPNLFHRASLPQNQNNNDYPTYDFSGEVGRKLI
ncbi:unnamed protein product [Adineta ricciae]|uniref:C3H1-type domain-containing protein n=1 Tax=Adineta ricciae TaxID=249248 RepID=A0A816A9K7_ADIRI|nr:unnamed protein product [Adineta ricciae]